MTGRSKRNSNKNSYTTDLKVALVNLVNGGNITQKQVANDTHVSESSIYKWKKKVNNSKPLERKKRESKYTPLIKVFFKQYVEWKPFVDVNVLIRSIKRNFKVDCSKSRIYEIFKELSIKKKVVYTKKQWKNLKKRKKEAKDFKFLMDRCKKDPNHILVSIDETGTDSHICPKYGWAEKGKKIIKTVESSYIRYSSIAAVSKNKVLLVHHIKGSVNAITFKSFLHDLLKTLPKNKNIYLLMDNARIHHAKIINEFLTPFKNVCPIFNIAYTPQTNPSTNSFPVDIIQAGVTCVGRAYITGNTLTVGSGITCSPYTGSTGLQGYLSFNITYID